MVRVHWASMYRRLSAHLGIHASLRLTVLCECVSAPASLCVCWFEATIASGYRDTVLYTVDKAYMAKRRVD